jgi:hypothetical protein
MFNFNVLSVRRHIRILPDMAQLRSMYVRPYETSGRKGSTVPQKRLPGLYNKGLGRHAWRGGRDSVRPPGVIPRI